MFKFVNMREEHLPQVLRWRTREDITRCLFTDLDQPSLEKQEAWFAQVQADPTCHYWVIQAGGEPVGTLFVTGYNEAHRRAEYGFYVGPPEIKKLGGFIPLLFYNYAFSPDGLWLHKLTWEVFSWYTPVIRLHLSQGAREIGTACQHVFKGSQWHDVKLFEMTATDWDQQTKWHKAKAEFEPWTI